MGTVFKVLQPLNIEFVAVHALRSIVNGTDSNAEQKLKACVNDVTLEVVPIKLIFFKLKQLRNVALSVVQFVTGNEGIFFNEEHPLNVFAYVVTPFPNLTFNELRFVQA
jgi:hypothetical protein